MSTKTAKGTFIVFTESWTEFERGWGQRYDGHTFHLSKEHRDRFMKAYLDRTKKDQVPVEYSTPDENLFPTEVDADLYNEIVKSGDGLWGPRNPKKWVG